MSSLAAEQQVARRPNLTAELVEPVQVRPLVPNHLVPVHSPIQLLWQQAVELQEVQSAVLVHPARHHLSFGLARRLATDRWQQALRLLVLAQVQQVELQFQLALASTRLEKLNAILPNCQMDLLLRQAL